MSDAADTSTVREIVPWYRLAVTQDRIDRFGF